MEPLNPEEPTGQHAVTPADKSALYRQFGRYAAVDVYTDSGQVMRVAARRMARLELEERSDQTGWTCQYGRCGAKLQEWATHCYRCGHPKGAVKKPKSRALAASDEPEDAPRPGEEEQPEQEPAQRLEQQLRPSTRTGALDWVDEDTAALLKTRKTKRGGKRTRRGAANAAAAARNKEEGEERPPSDGENAASGKSRASGSGAMRHPIAHLASPAGQLDRLPHVLTAVAGAAAWEMWQFARRVRAVAEEALEETVDSLKYALVVAEQRFGEVDQALGSLFDAVVEVLEGWVRLLLPNRVTVAAVAAVITYQLVRRVSSKNGDTGLAAARVPLAAPVAWSRSAKENLALSGRNPEANVDPGFDINQLRNPHPIYALSLRERWRTWPPIARSLTVLTPDCIRGLARNQEPQTWRNIVNLTEMPFEIFTEQEVAQMSPEQREELEWPHLFWEGRHIWFTPGDDIEFMVHVRGSNDSIYEVQLRAPEPRYPSEEANAAARRRIFQRCTCKDYAFRGGVCKHGVACMFQLALMASRGASGCFFPPSNLPKTQRWPWPRTEDARDWERWRSEHRENRMKAVQDVSSLVAHQALNFGPGGVEEDESEEETLPAHGMGSSGSLLQGGLAAASVPLAAPSNPEVSQGTALYMDDMGLFHGILDAKEAQAECVRMIQDCSSASAVDLAAFTIDRRNIIQACREASSLGAKVRVLVDRKNTLCGSVRDQPKLLGELASLATKVQVRVLEGGSLQKEYEAVGRRYAVDYKGNMHCKFLRVDQELLLGSCNWTTASRANFEACAKITLRDAGYMEGFFDRMWEKATVLTPEDIDVAIKNSSSPSSSSRRS